MDGILDAGEPSETCVENFIITDNTAPKLNGTFPSDQSGINACFDEIPAGPSEADIAALYADDCEGTVFVTKSGTPAGDDCSWSVTYTYTVEDECGNTVEPAPTVSYSGSDQTDPVITILDDRVEIECDNLSGAFDPFELPLDEIFEASDNCSDASDIHINMQDVLVEEGDCYETKDFLSKWKCMVTATDECGNHSSAEFYVLIVDTKPPEFTYVPADRSIGNCLDNYPMEMAEAVDQCSNVTMHVEEEIVEGDCDGYFDIIRTFTAEDGCGRTATAQQVIRVRDNTAPSMKFTGMLRDAANGGARTVDCSELPDYFGTDNGAAADDCSAPEVRFSTDFTYSGDCSREDGLRHRIVMTWTATDDCGNSSQLSYTINVVDNTPPKIVGVPEDVCFTGELPAMPRVRAEDECGNAALDFEQTGPMDCGDGAVYYERIWTATDVCGNTAQAIQRLTMDDTTPPVVRILQNGEELPLVDGVLTAVADCAQPEGIPELEIVVEDGCNGIIENFESSITLNTAIDEGTCTGSLTLMITATDLCDNTVNFEADINFEDQTPLVWTEFVEGATIECAEDFSGVAAEDACGGEVIVELISETRSDGDVCAFQSVQLTRLWRATDACGNATEREQVLYEQDRSGPVFDNAPEDECGEPGEAPVVTATDACSGMTAEVTLTEETVEGPCGTTLVRTWTAVDACGNVSTTEQRTFSEDTEAPELTFKHPVLVAGAEEGIVAREDVTQTDEIELPDFGDNAVMAMDDCSDDIDIELTTTLLRSGDCSEDGFLAEYDYTWTATDPCGNSSDLSIIVRIVDTRPPFLRDVPEDLTLYCGTSVPKPAQVTAADLNDVEELTFMEEVEDLGGGNSIITRTWTATDFCGNSASASQQIRVVNYEISCSIGPADAITCGSSGNTLTGTASGGVAPYTYHWEMYDCDGILTGGQGTRTITYNAGFTTQNFRLTVTDANGCQTTCTISIPCFKEEKPTTKPRTPTLGGFLKSDRNVELHLQLDSEYDTERYVIERSGDGEHFQPITTLMPEGQLQYNVIDTDPVQGVNHYRAAQVLNDGIVIYTDIHRVEVNALVEDVRIYPNPASTGVYVEVGTFRGKTGSIEVYNAIGQLMDIRHFDKLPDEPVAIDLKDYGSGVYTVLVRADGARASAHRLIVGKP